MTLMNAGSKLVVTILSDSPFIPTGYSNQAKLLAKYLREKGHEVHFLANAYTGATIKKAELIDGTIFDYNIYGESVHTYFMNVIEQFLKKTKSDIFLTLLDTFMLYNPNGANHIISKDLSPSRSIFWYPSDGGGFPRYCEQVLKKMDCPVAMSKFAKKQIKDYFNIDSEYIPLGTEPKRFYKLSDEERFKIKCDWGLNGKFVIGVVARNQPRKMLDRTLKTMHFLKDRLPNAVLLMHCDPRDPAGQMFDMYYQISRLGLDNRVIFTGMKSHDGFGWDKMNEIYNLMDVFFLSTSGEGFGIPIVEAMSCQVPVVVTDYTTTEELVKQTGAGLAVNLIGTETLDLFKEDSRVYDLKTLNGNLSGSWEVERGVIDCKDAANKIEYLYKNPEVCKQMGLNGRKAVEDNYDFNKHVGPKFEELFYGLCGKY